MDWKGWGKKILEIIGSFIWGFLKLLAKIVWTIFCYILEQLWTFLGRCPDEVGKPIWDQIKRFWELLKGLFQRHNRKVRTTNHCPQIVDDFETLAADLAPNKEYLKAGHQVKHEIYQKLHGWRLDFKVDRLVVAGSVGKNTAISYKDPRTKRMKNPDFDLVVFINNVEPPFEEILLAMKSIIEGMENVVGKVTKSRFSIQFTYHHPEVGLIDFDLLPAQNHIRRRVRFHDVGEEEARLAREAVRQRHLENIVNHNEISTDDNKLHSSAFCESTVKMIKERMAHPFYLKMVRLAKYWTACLNLGEYVPARSYMVELIAIHSQRGKPKKCPIAGFKRFLQSMANLRNLFVQIGAIETDAEEDFETIMELFSENDSTPIILDPANPYNNISHGITPSAIKKISSQARKTLKMLEGLKSTAQYQKMVQCERVENPIDEIFYPKG